MNGVLVVNKPQNITSFGVCGRLKKITGTKKIGHTGTLDPMAEGVLVVCLGSATRLIDYIKPQNKMYIAGIKFGVTSDTQDIWGDVSDSGMPNFSKEQFYDALSYFDGEINQLTPAYSARKIAGRALYSYARNGEDVQRPEKQIRIENIEVLRDDLPNTASIKVECSKGTYIRTICADLGEMLGCGAVMSSLVRIASDGFSIKDSHTLDEIELAFKERRENDVLLDAGVLIEHLPRLELKNLSKAKLVASGGFVTMSEFKPFDGKQVRVYYENEFIALGYVENCVLKPRKVFC